MEHKTPESNKSLLATDAVLAAAIADGDAEGAVGRAVTSLKRRGLLFHRGAAAVSRRKPSSKMCGSVKSEITR